MSGAVERPVRRAGSAGPGPAPDPAVVGGLVLLGCCCWSSVGWPIAEKNQFTAVKWKPFLTGEIWTATCCPASSPRWWRPPSRWCSPSSSACCWAWAGCPS